MPKPAGPATIASYGGIEPLRETRMNTTVADTATNLHPLDPLSAEELERAVRLLRSDPRLGE
jgi:Cu2+-containing amine oxidase